MFFLPVGWNVGNGEAPSTLQMRVTPDRWQNNNLEGARNSGNFTGQSHQIRPDFPEREMTVMFVSDTVMSGLWPIQPFLQPNHDTPQRNGMTLNMEVNKHSCVGLRSEHSPFEGASREVRSSWKRQVRLEAKQFRSKLKLVGISGYFSRCQRHAGGNLKGFPLAKFRQLLNIYFLKT